MLSFMHVPSLQNTVSTDLLSLIIFLTAWWRAFPTVGWLRNTCNKSNVTYLSLNLWIFHLFFILYRRNVSFISIKHNPPLSWFYQISKLLVLLRASQAYMLNPEPWVGVPIPLHLAQSRVITLCLWTIALRMHFHTHFLSCQYYLAVNPTFCE